MAEKATAGNVYEFPVNQELLGDALKLKEERKVLKQRLGKIESSRGTVSEAVFNKVRGDYADRLKQTTDQLIAKKNDIDRELATLYQTRDKIQASLKGHKEVLEETEFRFKLGEFPETEFRQQARNQQEKIAKFESIITGVLSNIARYESLFEDESDLFGEPSVGQTTAKHAEAPLALGEILEDEESEDYFSDEPRAAPPEWTETTKPQLGGILADPSEARIIVIAGPEQVGDTFTIQEILSFGRSQTNQIVVRDAKASRQHAEIRQQGTEYVLTDLNSSNGTCVNGEKIKEHVLAPNDQIQIGDFVFQFKA